MKNQGFSLIEILVAVLVLSIGLLGIAMLQIDALKNNQSALQRSQASMLAYFIMDAMRANRDEAAGGAYNLGTIGSPDTPACTAPNADGTLVKADQIAWFNALKENLGNADATCGLIACNAANCIVRVYWDDSRGLEGSNKQLIEIQSRL